MTEPENYLLLFADLIGSTEVASETPASIFSRNYISSFHWAAKKAEIFIKTKKLLFKKQTFARTIDKIKIAGDEVLSFTRIDQGIDSVQLEDMVASAVAFAVVTKLCWLFAPYNLRRILDKHFPREIAVGIHIGPVVEVPIENGEDTQIASLHINVTKRIETLAREGSESRIFVSSDVVEKFNGWLERHKNDDVKYCSPISFAEFKEQENKVSVKGVSKKLRLYELVLPSKSKGKLDNLMLELIKTPTTIDADLEDASEFFAKEFFEKELFKYKNNIQAIDIANLRIHSIEDYIELWFNVVTNQTELFSDEEWFILNCLLISGSLSRHDKVKRQFDKYVGIMTSIYKKLKAFE
jgi:class 3 adenylate cyclase